MVVCFGLEGKFGVLEDRDWLGLKVAWICHRSNLGSFFWVMWVFSVWIIGIQL